MNFKINDLKKDIIIKRCVDNDLTMEEAAIQIGISKATLSRLEKCKLPDINTFAKVCKWLNIKPSNYFE